MESVRDLIFSENDEYFGVDFLSDFVFDKIRAGLNGQYNLDLEWDTVSILLMENAESLGKSASL